MKGNSSCHVPNDKYREGYERTFRGKEKCIKCGTREMGRNNPGSYCESCRAKKRFVE